MTTGIFTFIIFFQTYSANDKVFALQNAFLFLYILSGTVKAHLWDINDVDPKDRAYLLGRQTADDAI